MSILLREFDEEDANTALAVNVATLRHAEESPYTLLPSGRDGQSLTGSSVPVVFPRKTFSALHNPFNGLLLNSSLCIQCHNIVRC